MRIQKPFADRVIVFLLTPRQCNAEDSRGGRYESGFEGISVMLGIWLLAIKRQRASFHGRSVCGESNRVDVYSVASSLLHLIRSSALTEFRNWSGDCALIVNEHEGHAFVSQTIEAQADRCLFSLTKRPVTSRIHIIKHHSSPLQTALCDSFKRSPWYPLFAYSLLACLTSCAFRIFAVLGQH